jgi:mannan polymerase II complex MNN10 subunit
MGIVGTPAFPMSLSRSPSPRREGGWSSPGLMNFADDSNSNPKSNSSGNNVTWAGAKKKSEAVNGGHQAFPNNSGFFNRHMRNLSNSLPRFSMNGDYSYSEKEKLGRGRWSVKDGSIVSRLRNRVIQFVRKSKLRFMIIVGVVLFLILYMFTRKFYNLASRTASDLSSYAVLVAQSALVGRR